MDGKICFDAMGRRGANLGNFEQRVLFGNPSLAKACLRELVQINKEEAT